MREGTYNFSPTEIENINTWVRLIMTTNVPGMSYYFTEDAPVEWDTPTYNAIILGSWPAPQVYTTAEMTATNNGVLPIPAWGV